MRSKPFAGLRRLALVSSTLLAIPAASCSLDQAALDSLLSSVGSLEGVNFQLHVNTRGGGGHHGDKDDADDDDGADNDGSDGDGSDDNSGGDDAAGGLGSTE